MDDWPSKDILRGTGMWADGLKGEESERCDEEIGVGGRMFSVRFYCK
jgi:hypothetical protein